jgi:DNA-binding MarR family transcriptional regulator
MKVASLPKSAIIVLAKLAGEGPLTPSQVAAKSNLAARTVSHALRYLRVHKLCKRCPNLSDMRQPLYFADKARIDQLHLDLDGWLAERSIYFRVQ